MDFPAPNFDSIDDEAGPSTQNAVQLTWQMIVAVFQVLSGAIQLAKDILEPKVTSVAFGVAQDNYALGRASVLLLTGASSVNLTGILAPDPGKARFLIIHNTGSGTITLKHESTSSLVGNRLHCKSGADTAVATDGSAGFLYLSSRYRQVF